MKTKLQIAMELRETAKSERVTGKSSAARDMEATAALIEETDRREKIFARALMAILGADYAGTGLMDDLGSILSE